MLSLPRLNSPGLHVPLHDVHAVLLVEGDAGDLVEADHVVLADQSALARGVVHEHPGDGGLAAARRGGRRARSAGTGGSCPSRAARARPGCSCSPRTAPCGAANTSAVARSARSAPGRCFAAGNVFHSAVVNCRRPSYSGVRTSRFESWIGRRAAIANGRPFFSWAIDGVVGQVDLGVEPAGQHPLVVADQLVLDPHVLQLQAGQGGEVGVGLGVEPGGDDVDDLDRAGFPGAGLEQFLLAAADGAVPQLRSTICKPSWISSSLMLAQ